VGPRTGLDDVERRKFLTLPGLEFHPLGRPARSQSLYRLSYPGSTVQHKMYVIILGDMMKAAVYPNPWYNEARYNDRLLYQLYSLFSSSLRCGRKLGTCPAVRKGKIFEATGPKNVCSSKRDTDVKVSTSYRASELYYVEQRRPDVGD
jgi:hypothetical protein